MIYDTVETRLAGTLIVAGDEQGLRHLNFMDGKHPLTIANTWRRDPGYFATVRAQLSAYFAGQRQSFEVDLIPEGTPFQLKVWSALLEIPYGTVVSYQWIANASVIPLP